tara:strand:- start:4503 stop:4982 length:480 start_codon:yes stop_codon:yes gene_type:complete
MALWGSSDTTANKPKFDNGSDVFGITAGEVGATTGDNVVSITLADGGTGYANSGNLIFTGSNSTVATGTFTASGGVIQTVTLTAGGAGYSAAPVITAATGSGLSVEVNMGEGAGTIGHTGWAKRTVGTGGRAGRVFWEVLVAGGMADGAGDEDIATPDA